MVIKSSLRISSNISPEIWRIKRFEDYFSEREIEILKKFKSNDDNVTLNDLWNNFISTAIIVYGEKLEPDTINFTKDER